MTRRSQGWRGGWTIRNWSSALVKNVVAAVRGLKDVTHVEDVGAQTAGPAIAQHSKAGYHPGVALLRRDAYYKMLFIRRCMRPLGREGRR